MYVCKLLFFNFFNNVVYDVLWESVMAFTRDFLFGFPDVFHHLCFVLELKFLTQDVFIQTSANRPDILDFDFHIFLPQLSTYIITHVRMYVNK